MGNSSIKLSNNNKRVDDMVNLIITYFIYTLQRFFASFFAAPDKERSAPCGRFGKAMQLVSAVS